MLLRQDQYLPFTLGRALRTVSIAALLMMAATCPLAALSITPTGLGDGPFGGALGSISLMNPSEKYPFRLAYPGPQEHALLTVPDTHFRQGLFERFDVSIRLYNDRGADKFYNVYWGRLIPLPGRLALYNAELKYVCDLVEYAGGSNCTVTAGDWTAIPASDSVDATLSVSLPYPTYLRVSAGTYYLQVIYLRNALLHPSEEREIHYSFGADPEIFRSNAVKITVVD